METTAHGDPDLVCSYSRLLAAPLYSSTADEEVHDVLCSVTDELRQLLLSSDTTHISAIARHMRDCLLGVRVNDRSYHFKTFRRTFVGSEAVDWILKNYSTLCGLNRSSSNSSWKIAEARNNAVVLGRALAERGLFSHVTTDHAFEDKELFYRFSVPPRVMIIGGGFLGSAVARQLMSFAKDRIIDVLLVDERGLFQCTPSLPFLLSNPAHVASLRAEHDCYLGGSGINAIHASIAEFDHVKRRVITKQGTIFPFDIAVIATGCRYSIPNSLQCGSGFTWDGTCAEDMLEAAGWLKAHPEEPVVVVGGGAVGVEVLGEILAINNARRCYLVTSPDRLLHRNDVAVHRKLVQLIEKQSSMVMLVFGKRVTAFNDDEVLLSDGSSLPCKALFACTGFKPNTDFASSSGLVSCLDDRGFVTIDRFLRVLQKNELGEQTPISYLFAGGDCAAVPEEKLAQNAEEHATVIVENIKSLVHGQSAKNKYNPTVRPMLVSCGPGQALMCVGDKISVKGAFPRLLKTLVEFKVMHGIKC